MTGLIFGSEPEEFVTRCRDAISPVNAYPETILAVDVAWARSKYPTSGFFQDQSLVGPDRLITPGHCWWSGRDGLESDDRYVQLVVYSVVVWRRSVLVVRRSSKSTETRLHWALTLAFGGHVNAEDLVLDPTSSGCVDYAATIQHAFIRETFKEELMVLDPATINTQVGVVQSLTPGVSSYHLGLVYTTTVVEPSAVVVRDPGLVDAQWVSIDRLPELIPDLESWSVLIAEWLLDEYPDEV
jgi:predicted NUDIX family phosphoesterase